MDQTKLLYYFLGLRTLPASGRPEQNQIEHIYLLTFETNIGEKRLAYSCKLQAFALQAEVSGLSDRIAASY